MKKKFVLILLSVLVFSCGNDDSQDSNETQTIVGQWRIVQRTIDGTEVALGECEPFSIYTFNEDRTYTILIYAADINSDCLDNPSVELNGTWQKNTGDNYVFTNSNNDATDVVIDFSSSNSFSFTFSVLADLNDPVLQTIIETYNRLD